MAFEDVDGFGRLVELDGGALAVAMLEDAAPVFLEFELRAVGVLQ
jgi:hypothetical protein